MTNSTNANTNTTSNTQGTSAMKTQTVSDSALSNMVAANVFHKVGCVSTAYTIACCLVDALEYPDHFGEMLAHSVTTAQARSVLNNKSDVVKLDIDLDKLSETLINMHYMTEQGEAGEVLLKLAETDKEAYAPTSAELVRRFPTYKLEKGQMSGLLNRAFDALESNKFTIDDDMLHVANQVQALKGGEDADPEAYVLRGCNNMDSKTAYISEFTGDLRGRGYQAACHGPIHAASDRCRALGDLHGVPMDYDVKVVTKVIQAEVEDMTSDVAGMRLELELLGPVQFILKHDQDGTACKKPYSFYKAIRTLKELEAGNRPYIGMAVGLDAKCSGPQLGALMVGDAELAAACGMSLEQVEDAYERCVQMLAKFGFHGFTRNGVKKAFMGIFYGQGYTAFTNVVALSKEEDLKEVLAILGGDNGLIDDDTAKRFHKAVTLSFGKKLVALRNRMKEYAGKIEGRIMHMMPDGFEVRMNYKVQWNCLNEAMDYGVEAPDLHIVTGELTRKFIKPQLRTKQVNHSDFVRNGFVNMIQATDALIARLIICHLDDLGAQHIISVHDCFRVNVTETHLLEQAIKLAYQELFGSSINCKTKNLPMGQDILGMYFEGANKVLVKGAEPVVAMSQFLPFGPKPRKMDKIGNNKLSYIIDQLGVSYYFAK